MAGDEVVQLYIRDMLATVSRPVMELKGFQRIHLLPGQEKEIEFKLLHPCWPCWMSKSASPGGAGGFQDHARCLLKGYPFKADVVGGCTLNSLGPTFCFYGRVHLT